MAATPILLALFALTLATLLAARVRSERWATGAAAVLRHRTTPWVIGVLTATALWWVAGATFNVEAISTDEASYLLQARLFASGTVTAPAPPIPEFFEQAWVIVSPRVYSKYPPGHALALAPGVALGAPWLMPFLLNLVSGALLFALLRRAVGPAPALLAWCAWVLSVMAMSWQSSYFSEVTLLACWLGAATAVWKWCDGGRTRWLVGAAALVGYGAVTRPLSILLLALPLAAVVLVSARRTGRWRAFVPAGIALSALLMTIPAWNAATTGNVLRSPLREYTETYIPWDRLGFAVESTAALRPTPPDLQAPAAQLVRVHREHTVARLPRTLFERAGRVAGQLFTQWRVLLVLFALIGIWNLQTAAWLVMASALVQFLGHAVWGHEAGWTIYYAESAAAWFVPGAVGVALAIVWMIRKLRGGDGAEGRAELAVLLAAPWLLVLSVQDSLPYRAWRELRAGASRGFAEYVAAGPDHAIYFIRYGAYTSGRAALIRNDPRWDKSKAWIVYDLGPRNADLLRAAPDRQGFLVDETDHSVTPIPAPRR